MLDSSKFKLNDGFTWGNPTDPAVLDMLARNYPIPKALMLEFLTSLGNDHLLALCHNGEAALLTFGLDVMGTGYDAFLLLDEMLPQYCLSRCIDICVKSGLLYVEPKGMPLAYLDFESIDVEEWARSVKTNPSRLFGAKYNDIQKSHVIKPLDGFLADYNDELQAHTAEKRLKYPGVPNFDLMLRLFAATDKARDGVKITGFVGDQHLYTLWGVTSATSMTLTHIMTTEDPDLRRKYSPYLVGHVHAARVASQHGVVTANFGAHLPYKNALNFDTEWIRGVRLCK